jgi:hypothetical protein
VTVVTDFGLLGHLLKQEARPSGVTTNAYVIACESAPKTYRRGLVQRAILRHLASAPAGFSGSHSWESDGTLVLHGPPYGITVRALAAAVYGVQEPELNSLRTVQRNVRRLEQLELVDCWHGEVRIRERAYVTTRGTPAPIPVSGLYVALRWQCAHLGGAS